MNPSDPTPSSTPKILFAHQNYPSQFGGLASFLLKAGWDVLFATAKEAVPRDKITKDPNGVSLIGFDVPRQPTKGVHRYAFDLEKAVINGQGFANMAMKLARGGYQPDIVVAHSGWGTGSFAKAVWPETRFVQYLEWWYTYPGRDMPRIENPTKEADRRAKIMSRNLPFLLDAASADGIITPTRYQAEDIPKYLRDRLIIQHDGVDCDFFSPAETRASVMINEDLTLPPDTRIVTYATRGMEPMRGFPEFMAAWAKVQHTHPDAHCLIAGNDSVHYADWLPKGESYKQRALEAHDFDMSRLHFTGRMPLPRYRKLLQRSDCHTYLTRPFVLSWSLVESMACGCPLVVSETPPVREALPNDNQARHVDHTDIDALAQAIADMLDNPENARERGRRARAKALRHYDAAKLHPEKEHMFRTLLQTGKMKG